MDIKKIKEIVNSPHTTDEMKEFGIINLIATDKNAVPDILKILAEEREQKRELISDMNLELSRAHVFIEWIKEEQLKLKPGEKGPGFTKTWILDQIAAFYIKNKGLVQYLFNRFD